MARSDPQFNLRLPPELRAALDRAKAKSGRSITAEIVFRLEQSFREASAIEDLSYKLDKLVFAFQQARRALAKSDPAFAAAQDYFADPTTAAEIYQRRTEDGKRAHAAENEEHERRMAELKASPAKKPKPRPRKR